MLVEIHDWKRQNVVPDKRQVNDGGMQKCLLWEQKKSGRRNWGTESLVSDECEFEFRSKMEQ